MTLAHLIQWAILIGCALMCAAWLLWRLTGGPTPPDPGDDT